MHIFTYKGKNILGETVRGKIEAINSEQARIKLKRLSSVTELIDKGEKKPDPLEQLLAKLPSKGKVVKPADLCGFLDRLSSLLGAGASIQSSLERLSEYGSNEVKQIPSRLLVYVRQGRDLSDAFKENEGFFGKDYSFMIKSGYESGTLPETLTQMSTEIEADVKLMKSIKSALAYPKLLVFVALAACVGIFGFVLPGLLDMMGSLFGNEPPAITKMLMKLTTFFQEWGLLLVISVTVAITGTTWYINKFQQFRRDKFLLHIPIFGSIIRNRDIIRLFRGLGNLSAAKIPNSIALRVSLGSCVNSYIRNELARCQISVESEGMSLVAALNFCSAITPMDLQILDIGVETGNLPSMLLRRADELERDNALLIKQATSLVEPIAMMLIGSLILTIVIAVYLPMFSIMGETV